MARLRLHAKHGANPTMPLCFWCEKPRGDIVLLGAAYKDEAPSRMVVDYEPCAACKALFAQGILVVETVPASEKREARTIAPHAVPTGRFAVIREEAFRQIFDDCDAAIAARKCLVTRETFAKAGIEKAVKASET